MFATSRHLKARSPRLITGFGTVLLATAVAHHATELRHVGGAVGPVVALGLDGSLALGLVYAGYRVGGADLSPEDRWRVWLWCLGGAALFATVMGVSILVRAIEGRVVGEALFPLLIAAEAGGVAGVVGGYQAARSRARAQTVEEQNERLEELAGVVSHDLRNPLNVASGRLELAREEHDSDHLAHADRALDRMDELVGDLLELARDGTAVDPEPLDLDRVVDDCWSTVETADATLVTDADQVVEADERQLKQLFENLIRNAVEHGGEDVTVTVDAVDGGRGFCVADDGAGVPEGERDEIFDAGYSTNSDGTGLGLNIVEEVVESHGWTVAVGESEDGGARFEFTGVDTASRPE